MGENPTTKKRIMRFSKRRIVFVLLVLAFAGIAARTIYQIRSPQYKTANVERADLVQTLESSGEVKPDEAVDLHFQTAGKLAWIGVRRQDRVKKWQGVASLDKRKLQSELRKYLNTFEKEMRDYGQAIEDNPLVNQRLKRILEQAHYDLTSSVVDVEIQNLALELATLVTPIDGIVTTIDMPVAGMNVTTTDEISIVNPNSLYFAVEVDETDIARVRVGQTASIVLDAFENERIESQVRQIDFQASLSESGSTAYLAKLTLPQNSDLRYKPGMNGEATITVAKNEGVLTLPAEAIRSVNGKTLVQMLVNGKLEETEVRVGIETDERVEILNGLAEGQTVITGIAK